MIHVLATVEVPRGKVDEFLEFFEKEMMPWEEQILPKVGGKLLGVWSTVWGKQGEITFLVALPNEEALRKAEEVPGDEKVKTAPARWNAITPNATRKIMRPASFSPIQ